MRHSTLQSVVLLAAGVLNALAQPAPAAVYAIRGGKVYTLTGPPIEKGVVVIRDGKIAAVGQNVEVPPEAQTIDAQGLEVYPGLFDAFSDMGLTEVGQVAATVDITDLGSYNPQLIAATAVHPSSELIPVARANGITHALAAPASGGEGFFGRDDTVIAGQASIIHLAGWDLGEMLISRSAGMVLRWPTLTTATFDVSTFSRRERPFAEVKQEYDRKIHELADWFERARHYAQVMDHGSPGSYDRDLKLEALAPVVRGRQPLLVIAEHHRDIKNAIEFCDQQHVRMILVGAGDAWAVKDLLIEKKIPVILQPTQSLPVNEDDPYDQSYALPGRLRASGIPIAFSSFDASFSRRLPYYAANAVPYGLPHEEALKAVTLYPAQILGVGDKLGTIEPGKIANLIVTDGDPLAILTQVKYLFIAGKLTSTANRQLELYQRYSQRH